MTSTVLKAVPAVASAPTQFSFQLSSGVQMLQVIFQTSNCSQSSSLENRVLMWSICIPITFTEIFFNVVNLALNFVSFLIFSADKSQDSQVRFSLCLLSLTEVVLAVSKQHFVIFVIMMHTPLSYISALVLSHLFLICVRLHSLSLCMRNFLVALISCSRAEVVARPMARQSGRLFLTLKMFIAIFCMYVVLSVTLEVLWSLSNNVDSVLEFCRNPTQFLSYTSRSARLFKENERTLHVVFLFLFAPVPVFIVMLATAVMLLSLRRSSSVLSGTCGKRKQRALRLILLLSILFLVFELPLAYFIVSEIIGLDGKVNMLASRIITLLTTFDSTCNFFVYFFTTKAFRKKIKLC